MKDLNKLPNDFLCSGISAGIKPNNVLDMALISSKTLASVAGVIDLWKGVQETGVASFDVEKAKEVREEIEDAIGLPDMWEIERQTVEYDNKHLEGRQVAGYEGYNQTEKK